MSIIHRLKKILYFGCFLIYFNLFLSITNTHSAENILIVLSSNIKAFYEFYQGFREESLKKYPHRDLKVLILSESPFIKAEIINFKPQTIIAVGPSAIEALTPIISKETFFPALTLETNKMCGISVKPPLQEEAKQLIKGLRTIFPKGKIYLIIPCQNCKEVKNLIKLFPPDIIPIIHPIKNFSSDLPAIFKKPYRIIYLRPGLTLATETIAKIFVKQALYHKKILFGFSSYFCKIGAAICFEHDYKAAGKIVAQLDFKKIKTKKNCNLFIPFKIKINQKLLKKILKNDS